jgi:hypothetical protein
MFHTPGKMRKQVETRSANFLAISMLTSGDIGWKLKREEMLSNPEQACD